MDVCGQVCVRFVVDVGVERGCGAQELWGVSAYAVPDTWVGMVVTWCLDGIGQD